MKTAQERVNEALRLLVKKRSKIENPAPSPDSAALEIKYLWAEAEDALELLRREQKSYDIRISGEVPLADN